MQNKLSIAIIMRSTLFWMIVGLLSVVYAFLAITLYFFLSLRTRHKILTSWSIIFAILARHLCRVNYQVRGREHITREPGIIASNHQSMWETIVYTQIFPAHAWIVKRELLMVPFFGWVMATLAPIAINRAAGGSVIKQMLSQSADRIRDGFWILLFPEGTRAKPGNILPFKVGVGRLALGLNIPVLPVAHNAGYLLPKNSFFLYPGTVQVIIGEPIYPQENETHEALTARIREVIAQSLATIVH